MKRNEHPVLPYLSQPNHHPGMPRKLSPTITVALRLLLLGGAALMMKLTYIYGIGQAARYITHGFFVLSCVVAGLAILWFALVHLKRVLLLLLGLLLHLIWRVALVVYHLVFHHVVTLVITILVICEFWLLRSMDLQAADTLRNLIIANVLLVSGLTLLWYTLECLAKPLKHALDTLEDLWNVLLEPFKNTFLVAYVDRSCD